MRSLVKANKIWLWSHTVKKMMKRKKEKFTYQTLLGTKSYILTHLKKIAAKKKKQHNKAKLTKQSMFNATFKTIRPLSLPS